MVWNYWDFLCFLLSSWFVFLSFSFVLSFVLFLSFAQKVTQQKQADNDVAVLIVVAGEICGKAWSELYFGLGGD